MCIAQILVNKINYTLLSDEAKYGEIHELHRSHSSIADIYVYAYV